ncbi:MAG: argininosuccinate synthase [Candidatus Hydrogenedentes bacterium]|nr:argininosuccinate synthase [Candidatus Hydrogenedentota bacterium]
MNAKPQIEKVVLAYSGGLDTSVIVPWLKENYGCEVVCFCADVGQSDEDLSKLESKAIASGASQFIVHDMQEEFAADYLFPMLRAGAVYERSYLLGTSVARPLIAKHLVDVAHEVGAQAIAHGATGKGNDQVRFELTVMALDPRLQVIAPWREWDIRSREDAIAYAAKHNVPVTATVKSIYSRDSNLWHISHEGGLLEDPWNEPHEDMFVLTTDPLKAPDKATYVEIDFEEGTPVAVDGKRLEPEDLLAELNRLGGENGVGRVDIVENRFVGMKSRGIYETPGGTILYIAHRGVESLTMDREVMLQRDQLSPKIAQLIYNGFWFAPEFEAMMAFVDKSQENVTGTARVRLYKGNCDLVGRKAEKTLYDEQITTFEEDEGAYDQTEATGFINLNALRLRVRNRAGLFKE